MENSTLEGNKDFVDRSVVTDGNKVIIIIIIIITIITIITIIIQNDRKILQYRFRIYLFHN